MRIGLLAYATRTGLGIQTYNFYKYIKPHKTMLVDISLMNHLEVHTDWYPNFDIRTQGYPSNDDIDNFLDDLDLVFVCETPLNYQLFAKAEARGIKTVLQYNFEFLDYLQNNRLAKPSVFAAPSLWNVKLLNPEFFSPLVPLPVPIDSEVLPKRTITEAKTFFHIAGRPAHLDRNGTLDFIAAVKMMKRLCDCRYIIYAQSVTSQMLNHARGTGIEFVTELEDYTELYERGDIQVLPRKYGGLCLPLQEAMGCGIPTLMTKIDPQTNWLPDEWLIPTLPRPQKMPGRMTMDIYNVEVVKLAQYMLDLTRQPETVALMHKQAKEIAKYKDWKVQKDRYLNFFEGICNVR